MISKEQAIEIAKKRAAEKGWAFGEPFEIIERQAWFSRDIIRFEIETNPTMRGTKTRFSIDAKTGEILSEGFIPR